MKKILYRKLITFDRYLNIRKNAHFAIGPKINWEGERVIKKSKTNHFLEKNNNNNNNNNKLNWRNQRFEYQEPYIA